MKLVGIGIGVGADADPEVGKHVIVSRQQSNPTYITDCFGSA